jgi:hypothetical protein
MVAKTSAGSPDVAAELAYLTRALKAPTLREAIERLAERARTETWSYEEFLAACLQREVSARESHGDQERIKTAHFPSRKSLEKFDFNHARGLKTRHDRPPGHPRLCYRQRQCDPPGSARARARLTWRSESRSAPAKPATASSFLPRRNRLIV